MNQMSLFGIIITACTVCSVFILMGILSKPQEQIQNTLPNLSALSVNYVTCETVFHYGDITKTQSIKVIMDNKTEVKFDTCTVSQESGSFVILRIGENGVLTMQYDNDTNRILGKSTFSFTNLLHDNQNHKFSLREVKQI